MDLGGVRKLVNIFISFWQVNCVLTNHNQVLAYHDPHVMEIYGNRFAQIKTLFLFPIVGNNAIEPERSVSLFEERSQKHRTKIDRW